MSSQTSIQSHVASVLHVMRDDVRVIGFFFEVLRQLSSRMMRYCLLDVVFINVLFKGPKLSEGLFLFLKNIFIK